MYHLYSFNGYQGALTIKDLSEADFLKIENYSLRLPTIIRTAIELKKCGDVDNTVKNLLRLFFGVYAESNIKFEFPPGSRTLLLLLAKIVRDKTHKLINASESIDLSYFDTNDDCPKCPIVSTPLGYLYCDENEKISANPTEVGIPKRVRKEIEGSASTSSEDPRKTSEVSIKTVVKHLEEGLKIRLKRIIGVLASKGEFDKNVSVANLKVEVSFASVVSTLASAKIINWDTNQLNISAKLISASITGCCKALGINVYFIINEITRHELHKILKEDSNTGDDVDQTSILERMSKGWSMSNFHAHHKRVHLKQFKLGGK